MFSCLYLDISLFLFNILSFMNSIWYFYSLLNYMPFDFCSFLVVLKKIKVKQYFARPSHQINCSTEYQISIVKSPGASRVETYVKTALCRDESIAELAHSYITFSAKFFLYGSTPEICLCHAVDKYHPMLGIGCPLL